jgi:hypothetical protein
MLHVALPNSANHKALQLGHGNQPTLEWLFKVDEFSLLSIANENNGAEFTAMAIDANNGNVGIGTVPTNNARLEVDGGGTAGIRVEGYGINGGGLHIVNTDGTLQDWSLLGLGTSGFFGPSKGFAISDITSGTNPFKIEVGTPSNTLYLKNSGNVGIGTNNPSFYRLSIHGENPFVRLQDDVGVGAGTSIGISFNDQNAQQLMQLDYQFGKARFISWLGGSDMEFLNNTGSGTITRMTISGVNGFVGIGTGSPSAKLHLEGSLRLNNLSGTAPAIGSVLTSIDAAGNAEWAPPAGATTFWSPNGSDIYNNNAGNVGIGTTAPAAQLHTTSTVRHETLATGSARYVTADALGNLSTGTTVGSLLNGTGSTNTIPYWIGVGTLGVSVMNGNSSNIAIGTALNANYIFQVNQTTTFPAVFAQNSGNGGTGVWGYSNNVGAGSTGVRGVGSGAGNGIWGANDGAGRGGYFSNSSTGYALYAENTSTGYAAAFMGGNVGIGTATPTYPLHVVGTTSASNILAYFDYSGAATGIIKGVSSFVNSSGTGDAKGITGNAAANGASNNAFGGEFLAQGGGSGFKIGVDAYANSSGGSGPNYGIRGFANGTTTGQNYGVYGSASNGATNWAGYFANGNVYVQNNMGIGTSTPGTSLEVNGGVTYAPITFAAGGGGGSVSLTVGDRSYIRITTTFGGASLASISNGLKVGQYLIIENTGGYLFTINDGAANLNIAGNALLYAEDTITLIWTGSKWLELSRSDN